MHSILVYLKLTCNTGAMEYRATSRKTMLQLLDRLNSVLVTGNHGIGAAIGLPGGPPGDPPEGPGIPNDKFGATESLGAVAFVVVDGGAFNPWKFGKGTMASEYPLRYQGQRLYNDGLALTTSTALIQDSGGWVPFRVEDISFFCIVTRNSVHEALLGNYGAVGLFIRTTSANSYILFDLVSEARGRDMSIVLLRLARFLMQPDVHRTPVSIIIGSNGNVSIQFEVGYTLVFQPITDCVVSEQG